MGLLVGSEYTSRADAAVCRMSLVCVCKCTIRTYVCPCVCMSACVGRRFLCGCCVASMNGCDCLQYCLMVCEWV